MKAKEDQLFYDLLTIFYIRQVVLGIFDRGTQRNKTWNFPWMSSSQKDTYVYYIEPYTYMCKMAKCQITYHNFLN